MPAARNDDLLGAITRGPLDPVYCLHGPERFLIDRCLAALRRAALGEGGKAAAAAALNCDVFELKESGLGPALSAARTLPMFAKRRLVIGRGVEAVDASEGDLLVAYLADPNPSSCLVLVADKADKVDGRLKLFTALRKAGYLHELGRVRDRELPAWLLAEASARKSALDPEAARALAEAAGPDLGRLSQALDQVALYAGAGERVERRHVEEVVAETRERGVFELTRAIGEGDVPGALRLLASMLRCREPALRIQFMLMRQIRQIWRARELGRAGTPRPEIASALGVPPFFLDEILGPARRMSEATLERCWLRLYQADRALKSSKIDEEVRIARLVGELAARAGSGARRA